jgi:hypothetical protein
VADHACAPVRELARLEKPDVGVEDHGFVIFWGRFVGESWGQGTDLILNEKLGGFVKHLLGVWNYTEKLAQINGKPCWVTHCNWRIHKIEPLMPGEGTAFDVDAWLRESGK